GPLPAPAFWRPHPRLGVPAPTFRRPHPRLGVPSSTFWRAHPKVGVTSSTFRRGHPKVVWRLRAKFVRNREELSLASVHAVRGRNSVPTPTVTRRSWIPLGGIENSAG